MASIDVNREHNQQVLDELAPGDLVSFKRKTFHHWAVYIGDGQVCHIAEGHSRSFLNRAKKKAKACIEDFWVVVGQSRASKRNERDKFYPPLHSDEIVERAKSKVDIVARYKNSQDFARWCRYDRVISEADGFSDVRRKHNERTLNELAPGDLVSFDRGIYHHWAVFIGDGQVYHLAGLNGNGMSNNIQINHLTSVCCKAQTKGKVYIEDFWIVAGDSRAYKRNDLDTSYEPLDADEIVERAKSKLGTTKYHFFTQNCEHFATWCRYDREECGQRSMKCIMAMIFHRRRRDP